jgi:two-component system, chemotaxis family, protein-glutamate methylesterase/glutaminase
MAKTEDKPDLRPMRATCPDCRGPLAEVVEHGSREYRCLVGHRFSKRGLLRAHSEAQERALWAAVVGLEEAAVIARDIAASTPTASPALLRQATEKARQAQFVRGVLEQLRPFDLDE